MKALLLCTAMLCALAHANADVVENTNFTLAPDTDFGAQYRFTVFQDEAGTNPTSLWITASGPTLVPVAWNVDEGADYYLVPNLATFTADTIGQGVFPPLLVLGHGTALNVGFGDFYLCINTGLGFPAPGQPNRDVFGWVHLFNDPVTGLTMLGNAISYGAQGIIVGTTTEVPEPAISLLAGLGLCLLVAARRGVFKRASSDAR